MLKYDSDDLQSLALCAWKEARGEGEDGMRAVMHVICNRAMKWYLNREEAIHKAVYAKNQFTSMSVPSDREFNLVPIANDRQYSYCVSMVEKVANGSDPDLTHKALYYNNSKTATSEWFVNHIVNDPKNHPKVATIGKQAFYL